MTRYKKIFLFILVAPALFLGLHYFNTEHAHASDKASVRTVAPPPSQLQLSSMASNINSIISNNPDLDIAVVVVDLNNNSRQQYGETDPFEAASTAKLITAADYLHHVEAGTATLQTQIDGNTAQSDLQQMIEVSDDGSWQDLNNYLGHPDLLSYASSIGLSDYDPDANNITASDIATLLQKLYEGQLLNSTYTKLLLNYMAVANYNDYIGAVVPSNVKFYHKAGVVDDHIHDAAIIDDGKHPIALVVFTKNEDDANSPSANQAQVIQQITTNVLNAYSIK